MKILYFYQYFSTPNGAWGTRVYEFAKEWIEQGHEVTVVTAIYNKSDIKTDKFVDDQNIDGIHIKILNIDIDNRQSKLKRIWSFIQYSLLSSLYALILPADIVIASSGPITMGIPGLIAKFFRGRKLIFEVRDLWPEGAIELGIINNGLLKRVGYWFERTCYVSSNYIVTLSPGMTENIKNRFSINNIIDVTNAANIDLFSAKMSFDEKKITSKTYAIYTGNIGMVNNSYWLYNAAKELKKMKRSDVKILLIGEGQQREELEELAKNEGVENFIRLNLMPKSDLVSYVQNSFVSLVPLKDSPVLDTSSPNKFFESLAAGVPVIQNTNGWMKNFIEENSVGFTLDPNDPQQLANKLIWLKDNPKEGRLMGYNGYIVAKKYFDKKYLANKMLDVLIKVNNNTI